MFKPAWVGNLAESSLESGRNSRNHYTDGLITVRYFLFGFGIFAK